MCGDKTMENINKVLSSTKQNPAQNLKIVGSLKTILHVSQQKGGY